MRKTALLSGLGTALLAAPALAHHPLGGAPPETFAHGLLSGIGHPMIGFDHLAFVIAVGIAAALAGRQLLGPAAFIAATLAGVFFHVGGIVLPAAELVIAASVAFLGFTILSGRSLGVPAALGSFAIAGIFHGWAYGAAIVGAEASVLGSYLLGLGLVQFTIAAGAGYLVNQIWQAASATDLRPRLAGAVVAGIGLTFLIENLESLAFPLI